MNLYQSQKTFTRSLIDKPTSSKRSSSWFLGSVACLILTVCPIPNLARISFGLLAVGMLSKSGEIIDKNRG